ncbi:protein argonaute 4 [Cinnamomum micranthum f. kanehirae]|uniref:Protein argonaute 4 n=1 Tax=Cinnamomum micranthum f. kanehirae TaxID=337451 RepID=A0A3S3MLC7_9MAGN|nr:protein argonaute 4 [Cinnamomum micranthum f. kanehirae]
MDSNAPEGGEDLPPPPPVIPPNVTPLKAEPVPPIKKVSKSNRVPMARPGTGRKGQMVPLLTNHFKVGFSKTDGFFSHYSVNVSYEDGRPVDGKGIGRRVIDRVHQTYNASELAGKDFAYDGEKSLFTVGALPQNNFDFTVVLEDMSSNKVSANGSPRGNESPGEGDRKRQRRPFQSKTFRVEIRFAAKIPMQAIANALRGQESESSQEALRVLDIILRQHAAKKGCLLVRQSFFNGDPKNFTDIGGGVVGCRGFHSSFRTTQGGLSLNMDVSTTMIIKPGPVIDFLIANQNVNNPYEIDWSKAKRMLKNLRIKTRPSNTEFKIVGLSEQVCNEQLFTLKQRNGPNGNGDGEVQTVEVTVYDYFVNHRHIEIGYSATLPCINVGKPKRPTYYPIELCNLVSLQRYTKSLSTHQRSTLVERSRQKPQERMKVLAEALKGNNYDVDPMLQSCGVSINTHFTQVEGRILSAPKLKVGNGEDFFPRNGRWNFNNKKLVQPTKIERWAVVNFSARCDPRNLARDLNRCGELKGIQIDPPFDYFEENPQMRRAPPTVRVEKMFELIKSRLPGAPHFLLCLLPERKNSDLYGPWKKKNLAEFGIVTQCIAPQKVNDQYLTNVLLKINAKLGGMNSLLVVERAHSIPFISNVPTLILGMDVSHGSPGQSDVPSIAAVVSSREWPLISRYRASVRTQSPKVEMIDSLFKPVSDTEDKGIIRELLIDFYVSSGNRRPDNIIIFRDGVSESQFTQVLNIELDQIIEACKFLDEKWCPKFTVIIAQKNHHTKFFLTGSPDNVPPGTVVDNKVCHPRNHDFYMCSHAGMIGTTRPTHYHVLLDEIGFTADDLQELVHSLSYVYQRSTTAISIVAPICYAHLAATQVSQFIKFDDSSDTSSGHGAVTAAGPIPVPELPKLHENVCSSMFFC